MKITLTQILLDKMPKVEFKINSTKIHKSKHSHTPINIKITRQRISSCCIYGVDTNGRQCVLSSL